MLVVVQAYPYPGLADQVIGSPPPTSLRYIEEEDPEWRNLDFDLDSPGIFFMVKIMLTLFII